MRFNKLLNESIDIINCINEMPTKAELLIYIKENNIDLNSIMRPSNLPNLIQLRGWRLPVLLTISNPKLTEKFLKALLILSMRNHNVKKHVVPKIIKTIDKETVPKYLVRYYERLYNKSFGEE